MIGSVDIGGTKIAVGIVDHIGRVLFTEKIDTSLVNEDPESAVTKISKILTSSQITIEGIGIGCTGPVYPNLGTLGEIEFLPGWKGFNLVNALQDACQKPVILDNDANAAALGEWAWGVGEKSKCFMMVTIGTGIGVGVVQNGRIYHGTGGSHPEMGHHVISSEDGPECFCGARGCWESLASGTAMERWAQKNHQNNLRLTGQQLCEMTQKGDDFASKVVQRTAHYLGIGIANLITLWMPDIICLGGGLMKASHLFFPEIERTISKNCGYVPYEQVRICSAKLGSDVGLIGAAQVWLQGKNDQVHG